MTDAEKQKIEYLTSIDSICLTYRHDFGLLSNEEQDKIRALIIPIWTHHINPLITYIYRDK